MSEQMPQGAENAQEQIQSLASELGPLMQKLQSEQTPEGKLNIIKQILSILAKLRELFAAAGAEDQYMKNFGQLEMQMQQAMGQLEG